MSRGNVHQRNEGGKYGGWSADGQAQYHKYGVKDGPAVHLQGD